MMVSRGRTERPGVIRLRINCHEQFLGSSEDLGAAPGCLVPGHGVMRADGQWPRGESPLEERGCVFGVRVMLASKEAVPPVSKAPRCQSIRM